MVIRDGLDCRVGERSRAYLDSTSRVRKSILLKRAAIGSKPTLEQPKTHQDSAFPSIPKLRRDNAATQKDNRSNSHSISNLHLTHTLTKRHNLPRAIAPRYSRPLSDWEKPLLDQRVDGVQSCGVDFDEDLACAGGGYGARFDREWGGGGGEEEGGLGLRDGGGHCSVVAVVGIGMDGWK